MLYFETLSVGIVAWVFCLILISDGMILGWYGDWLHRLSQKKPWIAKPLGYCLSCFSGQLGFWWYLVAYRNEWHAGEHIVFVCQTIFFSYLISRINERTS